MVHKMHEKIIAHLEEDMKEFEKEIQKDKALIEELKKEEPQPVEAIQKKEAEDEKDIIDDYEESMDEFLDSLGGSHKEAEKKPEEKTEEMRALG
jgi:Fe2+ transport system protein B